MKWLLSLLLVLTACRSEDASQADGQVVCTQDGRSFYVRRGSMDVSFLERTPSADGLCRHGGKAP